ncbi:MAG: hypothetical protein PHU14_07355 [Methylovulum sp.]|nr:hypothetical protein [Methylovulum sp.]
MLYKAQQRKLALLRKHIDSHQRNTLWAMIAAATLISLAVLFQ